MEKLPQIKQTLSEIDGRVPAALRAALRIGYSSSPVPADIASFAASLQQPPATDAAAADEELINGTAAPPALRIRYGSCYLPLHDHDAHFGLADAGVLGVADGVGVYARFRVDAGAFARVLMASALAGAAVEPACPCALLAAAYERAVASGAPGASTAVIVSLAGDALRWAYVGDSGFAVLRGGRIVCRSEPQQRSFNSPCRLSGSGEVPNGDSDGVAVARVGEVAVRDGDVVVVGTDGLFDNVRDEQLEVVVRMGTRLGFSAKNMADILAGVAFETSRRILMGKPDDITVLVAFLVHSGS
ncbi:unnamed protein product [Urochloa decumbens]|uniref:Protein phosphatase n=1 Tax=Urochloa decumbens TaxID=240449 RepID=A0ABC9DC26_9POAL